jgi:TRAP transporter 4TM/12TM fusion protein
MITYTSQILRSLLILVGIAFVFDVPADYLGMAIWREQIGLLMMGLVAADVFLVISFTRLNRRKLHLSAVPADIILAISSLVVFGYAAWSYEDLIAYGYFDNTKGLIVSILSVILISEITRRTSGWSLLILLIVFFLYAISASHFPGLLQGRDVSLNEVINYVVLDPSGLLGTPLAVVTTTVLGFVVFGAALFSLGGGKMFLDLAISSMHGIRGGTGKASIVASSLFGSISGSAVGNVVTTGIVTIPLMKRSGYSSREAAAIEAVASTGGQLMPPIMGSAAFIMADIISVPYQSIVKAALLPGILFYFTLFLQVHFRASKKDIHSLAELSVPSVKHTLGQYWPFMLPIILLLFLLFSSNMQPQKIAYMAAGGCLVAAFFTNIRPTLKKIMDIIDTTGSGMISIMPAVAVAGLVIGILSITGLGFNFGMGVVEQSGGNLPILLMLTALASLVLGMGLPTTAVYILMASLVAPALTQAGIPEIPAHLFVLYFGVLSMITPPICLASIAAASIAESDFIRTGLESMKLGMSGFFVPFIFVLVPEILSLNIFDPHYWLNIIKIFIGLALLAGIIEGYYFRVLKFHERLLLLITIAGLIASHSRTLWSLIGIAVVMVISIYLLRSRQLN